MRAHVQHVRFSGMRGHIHDVGAVTAIGKQRDLLPGAPAVLGAKEAGMGAEPERPALRVEGERVDVLEDRPGSAGPLARRERGAE